MNDIDKQVLDYLERARKLVPPNMYSSPEVAIEIAKMIQTEELRGKTKEV